MARRNLKEAAGQNAALTNSEQIEAGSRANWSLPLSMVSKLILEPGSSSGSQLAFLESRLLGFREPPPSSDTYFDWNVSMYACLNDCERVL